MPRFFIRNPSSSSLRSTASAPERVPSPSPSPPPPYESCVGPTLSPLRTSNDLPAGITSRLLPPHTLAPRVPRRPIGLGFFLDAGDGARVPLPTFTDAPIVTEDTDNLVDAEAPALVLAEADTVAGGTPTADGDTTVVYDGLTSPVRLARSPSASSSPAAVDAHSPAEPTSSPDAFDLGTALAALALSASPPTLSDPRGNDVDTSFASTSDACPSLDASFASTSDACPSLDTSSATLDPTSAPGSRRPSVFARHAPRSRVASGASGVGLGLRLDGASTPCEEPEFAFACVAPVILLGDTADLDGDLLPPPALFSPDPFAAHSPLVRARALGASDLGSDLTRDLDAAALPPAPKPPSTGRFATPAGSPFARSTSALALLVAGALAGQKRPRREAPAPARGVLGELALASANVSMTSSMPDGKRALKGTPAKASPGKGKRGAGATPARSVGLWKFGKAGKGKENEVAPPSKRIRV